MCINVSPILIKEVISKSNWEQNEKVECLEDHGYTLEWEWKKKGFRRRNKKPR